MGPALELLRRICQPHSRSLPHITVRYSKTKIPDFGENLYEEVQVDHLYVSGPGTFNPITTEDVENGFSTVFIKCESDQLERLSYKPDFPDSVFHLTVYDGKPSVLAADVYRVMEKFSWDFYVRMPPSRVEPIRKVTAQTRPPYLTPRAGALLNALSGKSGVVASDILRMTEKDRISLVGRICADVHEKVDLQRHERSVAIVHNYDREPVHRQGELWSSHELINQVGDGWKQRASRDHFRDKGLFLTPPEIADDIMKFAVSLLPSDQLIDFGDPALGSGIFIAALLGCADGKRIASAVGVEADRGRAALTGDRWRHIGLEVAGDDFLDHIFAESGTGDLVKHEWVDKKRSLVVANPPYVRFQNVDMVKAQIWRGAIERQLGLTPDVRCDMYAYFLLGADNWLEDNAISAWLLPTEFMFTNYGKVLREYLSEHVELLRLHMYGIASQFSNARVSSCVVFFRKALPARAGFVEFTSGGTVGNPRESRRVARQVLRSTTKWQRLMSADTPGRREIGLTVGDLFRVGRGIATGANKFFVVEHALVELLEIPAKWRSPVLPKAFEVRDPIIESDADGNPRDVPYKWLIDCSAPFDAISKEAPRFAEYLREIEPIVKQSTLVRRREPFYRQEANMPPRFVFTYMARGTGVGGRFRLNRSVAVALNNFLCLYPRDETEAWLSSSSDNDQMLLGVLEGAVSSYLDAVGREYADGLVKLEPRELRDMVLWDLPNGLQSG